MTKPDGMTLVIDQDGERMILNFPDIDQINIQNDFPDRTIDPYCTGPQTPEPHRVIITFESGEYTLKRETLGQEVTDE